MKAVRWLSVLWIVLALLCAAASAEEITWRPADWDSITEDEVIIITMTKGDEVWALSSETTAAGAPLPVTLSVSNSRFTTDGTGSLGWKRAASGEGWTFTSAAEGGGMLYCIANNNGVRIGTEKPNVFIVEQEHLKHLGTSRYLGVYVNGTTPQDWRSYTSVNNNITGQTVGFWHMSEGGGDEPDPPLTVNVAPVSNGTVEVFGGSEEGYTAETELRVKAVPDEGYCLTSLSWRKEGSTGATVLGVNDLDAEGLYWLTMPDSSIIISAVFAPVNAWNTLQQLIYSCETGDTVALTEDAAAGSLDTALIIPEGWEITLDLQGHTLDRALTSARDGGCVLDVGSGSVLTVTDSADGGVITGGNSSGSGGGISAGEFATVTLEGGSITGNKARTGGGVSLKNGANVIVDGAEITGNSSTGHGGGVWLDSGSFLTLDSGGISGNTAGKNGGGVYADQNTGFEMTGGTLSGNKALQSAGLRMLENSTFTLSGGTVTGNESLSATDPPQTVYVVRGSTFEISGSPRITGNKGTGEDGGTAECNVFLGEDCTLTVAGPLTEEARIAVTTAMDPDPEMETPLTVTTGWNSQSEISCFLSDAGYFVTEAGKEIAFFIADPGSLFNVTIAEDIQHGTVTADANRARAGDKVTLTFTPEYGYRLNTVTVTGGDGPLETENGQFIMPESDVRISADFRCVLTGVSCIDGNGAEQTVQAVPLEAGDTGMPGGAYAVLEDLTMDHALHFDGDAVLILGDGASLSIADPATALGSTGSLTVCGQSAGTGALRPSVENGFAVRAGEYIQYGGQVEIRGAASGIRATRSIRIHGGSVTVTAGYHGLDAGDSIEITGGTVTSHADDEVGNGIYAKQNILITGGIVKGTHDPSIAADIGTSGGIKADLGTLTLAWTDPGAPFSVTATSFGHSVVLASGFRGAGDGTQLFFLGSDAPLADLSRLEGITLTPWNAEAFDCVLPKGTLRVAESAFEGTDVSVVYIPDGCLSIGARAFRGCTGLLRIRIPADCTLEEDVFDGCGDVVITAPAGSDAEACCGRYDNCFFMEE